MPYSHVSPIAGLQDLATTETTQMHELGKICQGYDPLLGLGEFIYLKGVANTVVGSLVYYTVATGQTALTSTSGTVNRGSPLAVAMSANVANQFGWYQISGNATIKKTAVKVDPALSTGVFLSGTSGRVMQTSAAARVVVGARWANTTTVTSTTSTAVAYINRPAQSGGV